MSEIALEYHQRWIRICHALVTLEYTDASHIQHKATALYAIQSGEATTVRMRTRDSDIDLNGITTTMSLNYTASSCRSPSVDNGYATAQSGGR